MGYNDNFLIPPVFSNLYKEAGIYHGLSDAIDTAIHPEHYSSFVANYYFTEKGKYLFSAKAHDQHSFSGGDTMAWFRYADTFQVYGRSGALLKKIHYDKKKLFMGTFNNSFVFWEDGKDFYGYKWYDRKGKLKYKLAIMGSSYRYVYRLNNNMYALIGEEGVRFVDTNKIYYPFSIDDGMVFPGYAQMYDGMLNEWLENDGLLPVRDFRSGLDGFISGKGIMEIPFKYKKIGPFIKGRAPFVDTVLHKIGFLDKKGKMAIPPVLDEEHFDRRPFMDEPLYFSEGLCPITLGRRMMSNNHGPEHYYGYTDTTGKVVLVMPDSIVYAGNFSCGLAPVISIGKSLGFINKSGALVIPFKYEVAMAGAYPFPRIVIPEFINGFAYLKAFKGYIDTAGYEYFSGKRMQDHYDFSH